MERPTFGKEVSNARMENEQLTTGLKCRKKELVVEQTKLSVSQKCNC